MDKYQKELLRDVMAVCEYALYGDDDNPGLNDMTSDEFSRGRDKEIRRRLEVAIRELKKELDKAG